jgi:uncharacterized protein
MKWTFPTWIWFALLLPLTLVASVNAAPSFPELTGRVVDRASLLPRDVETRLEAILKKHEDMSSNQVVVVTIHSLEGRTIEEYGYQLGRHWGIGQADKDNGVLLIIAKNDRKMRIEVGYGLEGSLTDAIASNIIQAVIRPEFKKGRFSQGIQNGVESILLAIAGTYEPKSVSNEDGIKEWFHYLVLILIGIFFVSGFFGDNHTGGGRGGRRGSGYISTGGFGGFGGGGGGFSGGGGGFGGGGASGGW